MSDQEMDARFDKLATIIKSDITALRSEVSGFKSEIKAEISEVESGIRSEMSTFRSEIRSEIKAEGEITRRHFDVVVTEVRLMAARLPA